MGIKKILLIDDDPNDMQETKLIIEDIKHLYVLKGKSFPFSPQGGDKWESHKDQIKKYVIAQLNPETSFDVLMLDMLLAQDRDGDSASDPMGLHIIKELSYELRGKVIIAYTGMSGPPLDKIKNESESFANKMHIVRKPPSFVDKDLLNLRPCIGTKYREFRGAECCGNGYNRCTGKENLLCAMRYIHHCIE